MSLVRAFNQVREDGPVTSQLPVAMDTPQLRKARGAFFTPDAVAQYVTDWAVRSASDRVLEPSCGEAAFLLQAGRRLEELAPGSTSTNDRLCGAELHRASARTASRLLRAAGHSSDIRQGDFFLHEPTPVFDAVIGNPPYVRYQDFSGASRSASRRAALRAGVTLTNLASSWAAFTVHSALFLKPGGRLGLVLPAELLSVNYAAPVREYLMRSFARVRLVLFTERVFPGVLEEVVLLLADGKDNGPTDHCELIQARNGASLQAVTEDQVTRWTPRGRQRWSELHLDGQTAATYRSAMSPSTFAPLQEWGDTTLGMVTGANKYFAITAAEALRRRIPEVDLIRLSPPGSRHLRALSLTRPQLDALDAAGKSTWLFRPAGDPSSASRLYIRDGETLGVQKAYKCRVRTPWWRVPYLKPADLLLTYMNADTARLCTNVVGAHHLNSVHGVYLRPSFKKVGKSLLPLASLNSVSLLGAEVVGRAYGGGILKLEPKEADIWPMPVPTLVMAAGQDLQHARREVRDLLARSQLLAAVDIIDKILLKHSPRMNGAALEQMRQARQSLHDRRTGRGQSY